MKKKFTEKEWAAWNGSVERQRAVDSGKKVKCKKKNCPGHKKAFESCT